VLGCLILCLILVILGLIMLLALDILSLPLFVVLLGVAGLGFWITMMKFGKKKKAQPPADGTTVETPGTPVENAPAATLESKPSASKTESAAKPQAKTAPVPEVKPEPQAQPAPTYVIPDFEDEEEKSSGPSLSDLMAPKPAPVTAPETVPVEPAAAPEPAPAEPVAMPEPAPVVPAPAEPIPAEPVATPEPAPVVPAPAEPYRPLSETMAEPVTESIPEEPMATPEPAPAEPYRPLSETMAEPVTESIPEEPMATPEPAPAEPYRPLSEVFAEPTEDEVTEVSAEEPVEIPEEQPESIPEAEAAVEEVAETLTEEIPPATLEEEPEAEPLAVPAQEVTAVAEEAPEAAATEDVTEIAAVAPIKAQPEIIAVPEPQEPIAIQPAEPLPLEVKPVKPAAPASEKQTTSVPSQISQRLAGIREQWFQACVQSLDSQLKKKKAEKEKALVKTRGLEAKMAAALKIYQLSLIKHYLAQSKSLSSVTGLGFQEKLETFVFGDQKAACQEFARTFDGTPAGVAKALAAGLTNGAAAPVLEQIVGEALPDFANTTLLESAKALGDKRAVAKLANQPGKTKPKK
jgi:hypothetical protein